jgi:hypothetical protein
MKIYFKKSNQFTNERVSQIIQEWTIGLHSKKEMNLFGEIIIEFREY